MNLPTSIPHAPLGANASFDFGPPDAPAGFSIPTGDRITEEAFVGCRRAPADPWALLPAFRSRGDALAPLPKGRYGRFFSLAHDKWMIGPLVFKLATPFACDADPADAAFRYAPVVCGYLEYDNSHSDDPADLVFGLAGFANPLAAAATLTGFAFGESCGIATAPSTEVELRRDAAIFDRDIGPATALRFSIPPRARRLFPLAFGFFQRGFFYTAHFSDLPAVLAYGLAQHARFLALADARDAEFMRSPLAPDARATLPLQVRAWLAGTSRLTGEPEVGLAGLRELCAGLRG